ncbi:MAG: NAD(P)/FAD-dependent oxidoreductase [Spirochaetota bacterium]
MVEETYHAVVIGGGAAGLAAADAIAGCGYRVAIVEREEMLGGVLNQCIHNGFGLHYFKQELTGPEYSWRFLKKVLPRENIDIFCSTTVVDILKNDKKKTVLCYSHSGVMRVYTRVVVLAMGCRERNRGNIGIPGTRPAGVFTAGLAQRLVNIEGYVPGKQVVIVGSGDIGLIMARRMKWVGAEVKGVVEIRSYPSGLTRNIVQCLNDFSIPLYLSHQVTMIYGKDRVEAVDVTPLEKGILQHHKTFRITCDTLLLSVGLIPENELSRKCKIAIHPETGGPIVGADMMSSMEGVFACGNVVHVHDLVDYVTEESERTAGFAVQYMEGRRVEEQYPVRPCANVRYVVPSRYTPAMRNRLYFRPLVVKNNAKLEVVMGGKKVLSKRLLHVQPSEVISVDLKKQKLGTMDKAKNKELAISIQ